jgi:hypothetical protein
MVEKCQRKIISEQNNNNSSIVNEHLKLKIGTLQNAPRDPDKLEQLLKEKESKSGEVRHIQDIEKIGNRDWNIESDTIFGEQKPR